MRTVHMRERLAVGAPDERGRPAAVAADNTWLPVREYSRGFAALLAELRAAKSRQAAEKLVLGEDDLDVPRTRLLDARHTCATLMRRR